MIGEKIVQICVMRARICVKKALICVMRARIYVKKALICVKKALICEMRALICEMRALICEMRALICEMKVCQGQSFEKDQSAWMMAEKAQLALPLMRDQQLGCHLSYRSQHHLQRR